MTTRRAAVLGSPIAHSLSPVLHRAAYAALGLHDWHYSAVDVDEGGLAGFVSALDATWAGLSLTMPLKRAVLPLLDEASPLVRDVGAANTLLLRPDGRVGENTDVAGIVAALAGVGYPAGGGTGGPAVVLGGGATATSALAALRQLGCRPVAVLVRDPSRAAPLLDAAERLGVEVRVGRLTGWGEGAPPAEVVVSTLPGTAADDLAVGAVDALLRPTIGAGRPAVLLDVVYSPWPTRLAQEWRRAGGVVEGGLAMLVHQAAAQVELMTGLPAPVEAMATAGEAELRRRVAAPSG